MDDYYNLFRKLQDQINQMKIPHQQIFEMANRMSKIAQINQQHFDNIQSIAFPLQQFYESQQSIQNVIGRIPTNNLMEVQRTLGERLESLIPSLDTLSKSIPFEQISQLDLTFLNELSAEDAVLSDEPTLTDEMQAYIQEEIGRQVQQATSNTTAEWQQFIMKLYRAVPLHLFLIFMSFIFAPLQEYVMEEPKAYMQEVWEDKTGIDMTGETVAIIRKDTYLRAGRSKQAPVVLQEPLKKAQSVLRITRKGNWVQVEVLIDGETYSGWIEKSKII